MNTPTDTLAERLLHAADHILICRPALNARESASRLMAQHHTMMKQTERIAELESELEEVRGYYTSALDSERMWRAKADCYWQELADAQGDAEAWKREAMIGNARLRGEMHPDDNGIVSPDEIIPRLQAELETERALADRLALSLDIALGDWSELYATHETTAYDQAQITLAAWKEARRE